MTCQLAAMTCQLGVWNCHLGVRSFRWMSEIASGTSGIVGWVSGFDSCVLGIVVSVASNLRVSDLYWPHKN